MLTAALPIEWRAQSETLAAVVDGLLRPGPPEAKLAVQLGSNAEQRGVERLRQAGHRVTDVRVYGWDEPTDCEAAESLLHAVQTVVRRGYRLHLD
jgi:uroporphyrinogen-III synthase